MHGDLGGHRGRRAVPNSLFCAGGTSGPRKNFLRRGCGRDEVITESDQ
jgi:hypothetical protein